MFQRQRQGKKAGVFIRILIYFVVILVAFLALVPHSFELLHSVANGEISGGDLLAPFMPDKSNR